MSANFRVDTKVDELIYLHSLNITEENKLCFNLKMLSVSDEWGALLVSKLLISYSMPARDTALKKKQKLHFVRIVLILR